MQDFLVGMGDTLFLSTPSARRATQGSRPDRQAHAISIHAPSARRATSKK